MLPNPEPVTKEVVLDSLKTVVASGVPVETLLAELERLKVTFFIENEASVVQIPDGTVKGRCYPLAGIYNALCSLFDSLPNGSLLGTLVKGSGAAGSGMGMPGHVAYTAPAQNTATPAPVVAVVASNGRESAEIVITKSPKGGPWDLNQLIERLPLPDELSVTDAADVLGGSHWVTTIMHLVEGGNWLSWTHSPAHGEQRELINKTLNVQYFLPRVGPETNPAEVIVEGKEVLWRWCVEYEHLLQGVDAPSKKSVSEREESIKNLVRSRALAIQRRHLCDEPDNNAMTASPTPVMAESTSDAPATQNSIMKKVALIAALEHEWSSIEADISDATRNGLKAAAHTGKHGEWDKDKARAWAVSKGKIKQAAPVHSLAGAWTGATTRHTIGR